MAAAYEPSAYCQHQSPLMVDVLPDDHIETPVLRQYAKGANCLVVGAFKGATMAYLLDHGASRVVGFEPQEWAHDICVQRLEARGPANWELYKAALVPWEVSATYTGAALMMNYETDGAKLLPIGVEVEHAKVVETINVMEFMAEEELSGFGTFDLAVVNCEGAEYMLLPWLAPGCDNMLVQFHYPSPLPCEPTHREREYIGKGWYLYK